jgi:GNAT superfamily N-acetyltransferase
VDVRVALPKEVDAICKFGATYIPQHYRPLLGAEAAQAQVDNWWTFDRMSQAVSEGRVVVAAKDGDVIGVGEWSLLEGTPVIWKLYVHPSHRGEGIGPRLIDAIIARLPAGIVRLRVEHFAVNKRASAFYEREGFSELHTVEHPTNSVMNIIWRERSLD